MDISEEEFEDAVDDLAQKNFESENHGRSWMIVSIYNGVQTPPGKTASEEERKQHKERARKELQKAAKDK